MKPWEAPGSPGSLELGSRNIHDQARPGTPGIECFPGAPEGGMGWIRID